MGIWHIQGSAVAQYIIYGLYHAALFILFDIFERKTRSISFGQTLNLHASLRL